jgi:cell division protein FtsB
MHLTEGAVGKAAIGALILYLAAHGLTGRQGLISYIGLQEQERALTAESAALAAEIDALSDRANRLRTGSKDFDLDYLEERARTLVDAVRLDEVVYEFAEAPVRQNAGLP